MSVKQISVFLFCETVSLFFDEFWVARPQSSGWHPTVQAILQHLAVVERPPWQFGWLQGGSKVGRGMKRRLQTSRPKHPKKREVIILTKIMRFFQAYFFSAGLAKNIQIWQRLFRSCLIIFMETNQL